MFYYYPSPESDSCRPVFDETSLNEEDAYFTYQGRIIYDFALVPVGAVLQKHNRIRGGKGGFGSMLRAIGSQIEKTTNHEMCRDLSGRRMRDVNTEKKLKEWYANASERERRKMEEYHQRRQRRRELLEQGPLPGHKFTDRTYERQKRKITYDLQTALDAAMESILKDSTENKMKPSTSTSSDVPEHKRARLWIEELDNDLSSSDTSSGDENNIPELFGDDDDKDDTNNSDVEGHQGTPASSSADEVQSNAIQLEPTHQRPDQSNVSQAPKSTPIDHQPVDEAKISVQPISDDELQNTRSAQALEALGLDVLKASLASRGLKCGGTLRERASRLFAVKDLKPEQYPVKFLAKTK